MNTSQNREDLILLYEVSVADLSYFKTQQWNVTNYAILLLAGLVGAGQLIGAGSESYERIALAILAVLTAFAAQVVVGKLERSIGVRQRRLEAIRPRLGERFEQLWASADKGKEFFHSLWFLRVAIAFAGLVSVWIITRPLWH